ncbi:LOW QUALITY PROTEIN: GRB2 related adaptor protein b [Synchiropus picturatus]
MEAVALVSFTSAEPEQISFQKGDVIKVSAGAVAASAPALTPSRVCVCVCQVTALDSCWAAAELHGRRGFVPENLLSLLPHPWFAGPVSRLEAERRLRWQDPGVFLVRESESAPGEFSVSVSFGQQVEHFRVLEGGGRYSVWEQRFRSLNRLVDFYRHHSIGVDAPLFLRDPPAEPRSPPLNPYPPPPPAEDVSVCPQKPGLAQALRDFTPSHPSHLHFLRGDVIELLHCSGPACRGRCRGRVGIFPPEYVQPLQQ